MASYQYLPVIYPAFNPFPVRVANSSVPFNSTPFLPGRIDDGQAQGDVLNRSPHWQLSAALSSCISAVQGDEISKLLFGPVIVPVFNKDYVMDILPSSTG